MSNKIPRSAEDDYWAEIVQQRQAPIEEITPAKLNHTKQFSFRPDDMAGQNTKSRDTAECDSIANGLAALYLAPSREFANIAESSHCTTYNRVAPAGELSLGAAAKFDRKTGTNEWVDAHEELGRNR